MAKQKNKVGGIVTDVGAAEATVAASVPDEMIADTLIRRAISRLTTKATEIQQRIDAIVSNGGTVTIGNAAEVIYGSAASAEIEAFKNFFGSFASQEVNIAGQEGVGAFTESGDEPGDQYTWIANDDNATCDDCAARDGETESLDYWDAVGRPEDGVTICGANCRCHLNKSEADPLYGIIGQKERAARRRDGDTE